MQYRWLILEDGSLPLKPTGQITTERHVCTTTLIWRAHQTPTRANSIVVDPCFSEDGLQQAEQRLHTVGTTLEDIGYCFQTHEHADHQRNLPRRERHRLLFGRGRIDWKPLAGATSEFPGLELVPCPGHAPELRAVRFEDGAGEVWIAGDAVLDRQWLAAWQYYWPNMYEAADIVATWRSVGRILAAARLVVPGHGPPFEVDPPLLRQLLANFPLAEHRHECPEVAEQLRGRLARSG